MTIRQHISPHDKAVYNALQEQNNTEKLVTPVFRAEVNPTTAEDLFGMAINRALTTCQTISPL
jgi:hypothetical protein